MTPKEIMALAVKCEVGELTDGLIAAILAINNGAARLDRNNPKAVTAHNDTVLAAHQTLADWKTNSSDIEDRSRITKFQRLALGVGESSVSNPGLTGILPGRQGHTNPINPMAEGTGLPGQEKPPRYDKQGHTV